MRLGTDLEVFFGKLVPGNLRKDLSPGHVDYFRVRALSVLLCFSLTALGVEIVLLIVWHGFFHAALLKYDIVAFGVFCVLGLQALFFYKYQNYWLSALAFTSIYFLLVVILVVLSGGHESAMKSLLLSCPFVAFLVGGKHEGIQAALLVLVIGIVMAYLDAIDFQMPNLFSQENSYIIFSVDWIIALLLLVTCLLIYESALQQETPARHGHSPQDAFSSWVDRALTAVTPPSLQLTPPHALEYVRARALAGMLAAVIISGVGTMLPMMAGYWVWASYPGQLSNTILFAFALAIFLAQAGFYYRVGNYRLSGFLFSISYFACIAGMVLGSGGYDSPVKYFLLTCPLVSFMTGGIREGLQTSLYVAVMGIALAWLKARGIASEDILMGGRHYHLIFSVNWLVTLVVIMSAIVVYDTELQKRG